MPKEDSSGLTINTNQIKWAKDQFEIAGPLEHEDVTVTLRGAITKVGYDDNEDGTFDRVHTLKPKMVEIVRSNGPSVKAIDKRRQSQLLRGQIEYCRREFKPTDDEQEFYDNAMRAIRHGLPGVLKREGII
jgi:hypothetical protein